MGQTNANCKTALRRAATCGLALALLLAAGCASPGVNAANRNAQGVEQFSSGRYDDAIVLFQAALEENPDSAETYYNLGSAYQRKAAETGDAKLLDQAEDAYWTALGLNPEPETIVCCYRGLATASTARGDAVGAQQILEQWRDRNPNSIEPKLEIAYLLEAQEKDADAYKLLQEIAEEAPGDYRAFYKMGTLSERAGDLTDAIENVNVALKLNPNDSNLVQRANALEAQYLAQQRQKANEAKENASPTPSESSLDSAVAEDAPAGQTARVQSTSAAQFEDVGELELDAPAMDAPEINATPAVAPQTQPQAQPQATPTPLGRAPETLGFGSVVASSTAPASTPIRMATSSPTKSSASNEPDVKWLGSVAPDPATSENKIAQTAALLPKFPKKDDAAPKSAESPSNGLAFANPDADGSGVGKPIPTVKSADSSPSLPVAQAPISSANVYAPGQTVAKPASPASSPAPKPRAALNSGPPNVKAGSVF